MTSRSSLIIVLLAVVPACGGGAPSAPASRASAGPGAETHAVQATPAPGEPVDADDTRAHDQPPPAEPAPVVLPRPPFERFVAAAPAPPPARARVELVRLSQKRNQITDEERWFREHDLSLPVQRAQPGAEVPTHRGVPLAYAIEGELRLLVYQRYGMPEIHLQGVDPDTGQVRFAFDFTRYAAPPQAEPGAESLVQMELRWAAVAGDTLFVSHAHWTYAASSRGANAYITALRIPDGALLWRSRPLVSNARNFVLVPDPCGDLLITGYGFTAEPDFLYVLDAASGEELGSTKLRTGPDYIIPKGDVIHVRTYDHDYRFRLKRQPCAR